MTPGREPGRAAAVRPPGGGSRTARRLRRLRRLRWLRRLRRLGASSSLPAVLLFLALAAVFGYGHHRGGFFRLPANDRITFDNLALAESLFSERGPARYYRLTLDDDGAVTPEWHNWFPLGGHLLLKGAAAVFGGGFAADLLAARLLMLAFMAGAASAAYLSLRRLTGNAWIALTATLLGFSSYYQHYADLVATDGAPDLFGFLLTFHGLVVFAQERRFRQLLVKTAAALFLGWHALALIAVWVLAGVAAAGRRAAVEGGPGRLRGRNGLALVRAALRSRHLTLGAAALVFAGAMLTFQFAAEYYGSERETAVGDLPSYRSMLYRTGRDDAFNERHAAALAWRPFLEQQFHRLGRMVVPYALPGYASALDDAPGEPFAWQGIAIGASAAALSLIGAWFAPGGRSFFVLALSGFVWAIAMRNQTAFHDFEALYYIGVPLASWSLVSMFIARRSSEVLVRRASVPALVVFLVSGVRTVEFGYDAWERDWLDRVVRDFEEIRPITAGGIVFVPPRLYRSAAFGGSGAFSWYLAGSVLVEREIHRGAAEFALDDVRRPGPALLSPGNSEVFLYRTGDGEAPGREPTAGERTDPPEAARGAPTALTAAEGGPASLAASPGGTRRNADTWRAALRAIRSGEAGPPALRGPFDLYLRGRELLYFKEPCAPEDVRADFLLHLFDHDRVGRGARRDFENRDFEFRGAGVVEEDACLAVVRLPERRIASVRTGQWAAGEPASWTGVARVDFERHRAALESIVSGQAGPPAARGTFDLYRDGRRLLYHREDCREEDVEADFFLDLHPSEVESLPPRRREEGFEDLHFPFSNHGVVLDGQCLLLVTVPDYRIRRLVTGQFVPDGGTLWQVEIEPGR